MFKPSRPQSETKLARSKSSAHLSPGIQNGSNHDLEVAPKFLESYPLISGVLKDDRLLREFKIYDGFAQKNKRYFHAFGLGSLVLGLISLVACAIRVTIGDAIAAGQWLHLLRFASYCGGTAILLVIILRLGQYRRKWCLGVFCRERLRHWHFQLFLDGRFVCLWAKDREQYQELLSRRWEELQQNLRDGYGMMAQFVNFATLSDDLFHHYTPYSDLATQDEALSALTMLRFDHQLRFGRKKVEPEGGEGGLALAERTSISETIASTTLWGAVICTASSLLLPHILKMGAAQTDWTTKLDRRLSGIALLLAVLSASSRAFKAGFTLPDESESYEQYGDRVRELRAQFGIVREPVAKLRCLEQLERESAAELRRFLRMKMRATFLF